jgi:hypothetical protein
MGRRVGRGNRLCASALAGAALVTLLAGCGGLPPQQAINTSAGDVVVAVLDKSTNKPVTVDAVVILAGDRQVLHPTDGFITFHNVPFGTDSPPHQPLTVTATGYVTSSQQAVLNTSQATYVSATLEAADPAATGIVTGTVTATGSGVAIANAVVTFVSQETTSAVSVQGFTDNGGAYIIGGIPAGNVKVTAGATGYLVASAGASLFAGSNPALNFALIPGDTKVDVPGKVVDLRTQLPLDGAQVAMAGLPAVTTAGDGTFLATQVPAGSQSVVVTRAGYDTYTASITVAPGMAYLVIGLNVTEANPPPSLYNLSGNVQVSNGSDPPNNSGVTVTATDLVRGGEAGRTTTNTAGDYYLLLLPGSYRIQATIGTGSVGTTVVIRSGRIVTGVNFALTP